MQWNLLEADIPGIRKSVRLREVSDYGRLKMHVWLEVLVSVHLREVSISGGSVVTHNTTLKLLNSFHLDDKHNKN